MILAIASAKTRRHGQALAKPSCLPLNGPRQVQGSSRSRRHVTQPGLSKTARSVECWLDRPSGRWLAGPLLDRQHAAAPVKTEAPTVSAIDGSAAA